MFYYFFWVAVFLFVFSEHSFSQDSSQIGSDISNSLRDYYMKDRDTLNDVLFAPGNDESRKLKTIGGEEGKAVFNCNSEFPFARISYLPTASGDIDLSIYEDLDLDGNYEYVKAVSGISGICTKGFIQCNPGTTDNCFYSSIGVDNLGGITIGSSVAYSPIVDSCYFINGASGNISTLIPDGVSKILSDVSGLVSNLVSQVRDFVGVVSYKDYQNFTVKLSGSRPTSCISANTDTLSKAKTYYSSGGRDDSALMSDVDALKSGIVPDHPIDGMDPSTALGIYEYASTSPSLSVEPPPDVYDCVIKNVVSHEVVTRYENCSDQYIDGNGETWCIVDLQKKVLTTSRSVCRDCDPLKHSLTSIFEVKYNQKWAVALIIANLVGDRGRYWIRKVSNDGVEVVNDTYRGYSGGMLTFFRVLGTSSHLRETHEVYGYQKARAWGKNHSYPPAWGKILMLKSFSYVDDDFYLSKSNNCPSDCKLAEEWVCDKDGQNCVQTYSSSGFSPVKLSPMCYSYSTSLSDYYICATGTEITVQSKYGTTVLASSSDQWFYIKRKYSCENSRDPNMPSKDFFDDAIKTRESVYTGSNNTDVSFNPSTGKFVYQDYVSGQGQTKVGLLNTLSNNCKKVCRVKVFASSKNDISASSGEASPNTGVGSVLKAKETMDYITVRSCEGDVCPYDPSTEKVIASCFCLDTEDSIDSESFSAILGVYQASKDMICSSSPP